MSVRQKITVGSILEIQIDNEYFVYAQILENANYAFFDFKSNNQIKDFSFIDKLDVLFIVAIYDNAITKGHWLKVGKSIVRNELKVLPNKFIQDVQNPVKFEFYNPNNGQITPATKKQIIALERAAVWEAKHIEDRIKCHYEGTICKWLIEDIELFKE